MHAVYHTISCKARDALLGGMPGSARKATTAATRSRKNDGECQKGGDTSPGKWWKKRGAAGSHGRSAFGAVLRPFKAAVSTHHKTRFMEDGFDLDLAYVTKRIIVHGVPNESADPLYDDPRTEVRRLLDKYHFDRYKVYNFASDLAHMTPTEGEQGGDAKTERYPFTDDTCPPLESVVDFCENAKAWLDANKDNVVSLHCKAGKGRAGIMAACLMVRMGETAHEAVASYDAAQASDVRGRPGVNQRAWVFLYERLIREVWGLRDTIGTVSGQNPSLRAPPRVATSLREVSLQLQIPPRRVRWRPILHHPSCAVYQQTPGGKALVHRAKMPSVCFKKKGQSTSVFAATLPRSVVLEGTFQVVVSAATGIFGLGKNILDVWCNTTFLGEDGGREIFTFTENDLPPGPLAERLLAARVSVVLTHTQPDAASPACRHTPTDWEGLDSSAAGNALTFVGPVEHTTTPETDPEASDDARENEADKATSGGALTVAADSNAGTPAARSLASATPSTQGDDDDRRLYLSSDPESAASSPGRMGKSRLFTVDSCSSSGHPPWSLRVSAHAMNGSGWCTPARSARSGRSAFDTPMSGTCPSPLRSCPRAAVSLRREKLNERSDRPEEPTAQKNSAASKPRWASSKAFGVPPGTHNRPLMGASVEMALDENSERLEIPSRRGTPLAVVEQNSLAVPGSRRDGAVSSADVGRMVGVRDTGDSRRQGPTRMPWAVALPRRPRSGPAIRLHKLAVLPRSPGNRWGGGAASQDQGALSSPGEGPEEAADGLAEANVTAKLTPPIDDRIPSPGIQLLLETTAMRSFDDLLSSRHSSVFGSEADQSEPGSRVGSFSDGDGEKASHAARVLAGWVDSGIRRPLVDFVPMPGLVERCLVATEAGGGVARSGRVVETEDLMSIPPVKDRVWPPPKRVVAGEMEIQGALESEPESEGSAHVTRRPRKHCSTGTSWGEDAKLALARKRLHWEKSRRGSDEGTQSLRLHAALVAKREAELLAIETDVKAAVRLLEERIARRESAQAALQRWRRELPPKAYEDVMECIQGSQTCRLYGST